MLIANSGTNIVVTTDASISNAIDDRKKISPFIEEQFPDWLRTDSPRFVQFVKLYYEWLDTPDQAISQSKNIFNLKDIDTTTDELLNNFLFEIGQNIPKNSTANTQLILKNVKDIYRARGTQKSTDALFRILFDENISYYYPFEDVLRASDGRWTIETSIRLSQPLGGDFDLLIGSTVVGETSGATGIVERIVTTKEKGALINELFLSSIVGTFVDDERVEGQSNSQIFGNISSFVGPIDTIEITEQGGAYHRADDVVSITGGDGTSATARVETTTDDSAVDWLIAEGGSGYTVNAEITLSGGSGTGTGFTITSISNTELLEINQDLISIQSAVLISQGTTFPDGGANTADLNAAMAAANSSTVLDTALTYSNGTFGKIATIEISSYGYGYQDSLPTAVVEQKNVSIENLPGVGGGIKGADASIVAFRAPGTIETVSILSRGTQYSRDTNVTLTNTTRDTLPEAPSDDGAENAIGTPSITGFIEYPGKYTDTKGFLSWNNVLQDNYFYQAFSYVIRSTESRTNFETELNALSHPAGTKMFNFVETDIENQQANVHVNYYANTDTVVDVERFANGAGNLFVYSNSQYNVYGNNTQFTTLSNGESQFILPNANAIFTVNVATNNTFLTLTSQAPTIVNSAYFVLQGLI